MKFIWRMIQGGLIGILVGFMLALLFSVWHHASMFMPSSPAFIAHFSSQLMATIVSVGLWALMGIVFRVASLLIFTIDRWSITRQTIVHFLVTYVFFTPLAIAAGWFPLGQFLISYSIEFVLIYIISWLSAMQVARHTVRQLNRLLTDSKR